MANDTEIKPNGWSEWSRYVLKELERLDQNDRQIIDRLDSTKEHLTGKVENTKEELMTKLETQKTELTILKTKASFAGALSGGLIAFLVMLVQFFLNKGIR